MNKKKFISKIDDRFLLGIAHRGYHNLESVENGLKAFQNAINYDLAFEFDVHLTRDNQLVVCHDEDLKRTTGKEGIIEDLTFDEIRNNYRLYDGGVVPSLKEVLDLNHEQVPMVIELKVFRKNYKALSTKVIEELASVQDKSKVLIISFDPRSLWPFKKQGFMRSLLVAKSDEYTWPFRHTVESVDMERIFFKENRVRRYAKRHFVNAWTVENERQLDAILPYVDTVTFQYLDPLLVKQKLYEKRGH